MRGTVEKVIDSLLSDENLAFSHAVFEALKPYVRSREDALFGCIYGYIVSTVSSIYTMVLRRTPTQEELNEAVNILQTRLPQIKSRIRATFT